VSTFSTLARARSN